MVDEPILFRRDPESSGAPAAIGWLLCAPAGPVRLSSFDGQQMYEPGRDFERGEHPRQLRLPSGSRIPALSHEDLFPPPGAPNAMPVCRHNDRHLLWCEQGLFARHQVLATYEPRQDTKGDSADVVSGPAIRSCSRVALATTARTLASGGRLRLAVFGDSIASGANATRKLDLGPRRPEFAMQVAEALRARCAKAGGQFAWTNHARGGMTADWGLRHIGGVLGSATNATADPAPDLLILAWGMNDATARRPAGVFADHVRGQMQAAREVRPDMDIVLVAPMTPHPDWQGHAGDLYEAYRDELAAMCDVTQAGEAAHATDPVGGIVLADVTSVWQWLLQRKPFTDLTGSGINHPNDYGHRVYAAVVDQAILRGIDAAGGD